MQISTTLERLNEGIGELRKNGGAVVVNGSNGTVNIQGVTADFSFDHDSEVLTVKIIDKPWLVSDSMIEEKIKEYFK